MTSRRQIYVGSLAACALALGLVALGCQRQQPTMRRGAKGRAAASSRNSADVLLSGIATTLNDLTNRVDLDLNPEQPILTARTTDDGNEVLAICTASPYQPDGPVNYLSVPAGNFDFRAYDVQLGDIVRYYVNLDDEAAELGFEDRQSVRLRVRRVDRLNPSAIVLEGGLSGPVLEPQRMEIWRFSDERLEAIGNILQRYYGLRRPAVGWEPSPDEGELQRLVERCNQWWRNQTAPAADWSLDPLLETLPEQLKANEHIQDQESIDPEQLENGRFAEWAGRRLQQAIWCRDISNWARGSAAQKQDVAAALFDWTVRHVQLADAEQAVMVHHPWQALIYGLGTAEQRAWVFVELCRQQQIDAVVLGTRNAVGDVAFWLPAALIEGQLYLFDAKLGLPIPSPSGAVAATLDEVAADPSLLDQLNVDSNGDDQLAYRPAAGGFEPVAAWVVAAPEQLARRYADLQGTLEGEEFVVLAARNARIVESLENNPAVGEIALWPFPWQSLADQFEIKPSGRKRAIEAFEPYAVRPRLWKARLLHFLGRKEASVADRDDPLATAQLGHTEAALLYQDPRVMPPESVLSGINATNRAVFEATKAAATYWMGLLSYDRENYELAARWLRDALPELEQSDRWNDGARYNAARALEAMGETDQAIQLLESDPADSPQRHGNLLRARKLRQQQQGSQDQAAADPEPSDG